MYGRYLFPLNPDLEYIFKMKQTNYQLFDFLDLDPEAPEKASLWRAVRPTAIDVKEDDVVVTIPFQKQLSGNNIAPDLEASRLEVQLRIRAYGEKILRIGVGFSEDSMGASEMLAFDKGLKQNPLHVEVKEKEWIIFDKEGIKKAVFNFEPAAVDHWSDLLPPPQPSPVLRFFPEDGKEICLNSYDQFFPARQDAFALAFVETEGGTDKFTLSFHAHPDEKFAGTGERFAKMDLSGRTFQLKNQDGQGVNNRRTYKNIPFYLSSRMYGCFLHTSAFSKFSLADHSTRSVQILTEAPQLDVFLFGGSSPEEILRGYRQITGFPTMPPLWSYGIWMSRMTYFSAGEVTEICHRLRREDYPCDVIHLDTGWFRTDWLCEWKFNPERFPDPPAFIADLKNLGFRVSLWQMPYVAAEAEQLEEALANHYISRPRKSRQQGGSNFSALDYAGTIDFTYPEAVRWYQGLLKNLLEMGVVCIKTDFGEDIHLDADYHAMDPEQLNNLYALLYQKAAYEITRDITGEGIIWARAGWAGCQRYPLHWGGDAACSWDGMAGSLKGGLHLGLSGFAFWSHDVPGFHGLPDFMNAVIPDDLYVRWTQFGVFSSHIRYHGTSKREPYAYPAVSGIVRRWWRLRYALIPYILAQSEVAIHSGCPVLRALIFHHPQDKMCWHIDDQYYFGEDLLVAPVMNAENERDVYLPEGEWVNFFDGSLTSGGKWLYDYHVGLDEMPVWVRRGARLQLYPEPVNCTDDMDLEKTTTLEITDSFRGIFNQLHIN